MRWLAAPLFVVLLGGCLSEEGVPVGIPVDDEGRALPTVHGIVVDDAIRPLEGVVVRFLGTEVNTTTNANGEYEIYDPVQTHHAVLVTAFKPGFFPLTNQVQVSGRISARLDFGLEVNPYTIPHVGVLQFNGNLGCRARLGVAGETMTHSCDPPNPTGLSDSRPAPGWYIDTTPGLAGAVVEVHWNPTSPFAESLHVLLRGPVAGGPHGTRGEILGDVTGPSPIRFEVPEQKARSFGDWKAIVLEVEYAEPSTTEPVVVSRNQLYSAIATLFYVDPATEGYRTA